MSKLTIVGGTYFEKCVDPQSFELFGSGLRAAAALSNESFEVHYNSCIGIKDLDSANFICRTYGIVPSFEVINDTIIFQYYHPLSRPEFYHDTATAITLPDLTAENILYFGLAEAAVKVRGSYVVYDPQNWVSFKKTGSSADHLALVLNRKEAYILSGLKEDVELGEVGKLLLVSEGAEVVIIKNGAQGALVIEANRIQEIPVFDTSSVWPIGSGDIFSAAFAWKWMMGKLSAADSALFASQYTAYYCETRVLPLPLKPIHYNALPLSKTQTKIYLAGPFFNIAERWLINELRNKLLEFGNYVTSPFHDVGVVGTPTHIANEDLKAIQESDVILAVANGLDVGTIFEIGYAKALNKKVVVLSENVSEGDLTMLIGSGCIITNDIATAVYKASW